MHDLLMTAPLVNKTWQSTLTPSVQRALFFEPDPSSERTQNPLLAEPPALVSSPLISLRLTEHPAPLQFEKTTIYPGFLATYLCSASLLLFFSSLSFMDPSGIFGSADAAWGSLTPYDNSGSSADTSSFQLTSADDSQPPYSQTPAPPNTEAMLWSMLQEMCRDSHGTFQLYSQQQGETMAALNSVSAALAGLTNLITTMTLLATPTPALVTVPVAPVPVPTAPVHTGERPLRSCEPRMFSGATAEVEPFLDEVKTNIWLQHMTDDRNKTSYIST
ncbi:hypothetical protein B0H14DRAFT_3501268 [Mycena olivaceomarginata]|nr:hypothetical protein B0H14DRAFT_3501268 [Mycena olivaceomarginata]